MKIGHIDHYRHGLYYIFCDNGLYGISREDKPVHCAYVSLTELFKIKGL
jgi:hypothetical protein